MQMNETRPPIALVLAADDAYARPMAVAIFSALQHLRLGWDVRLYLIDGGIQPHNKERIEQVVSMHPVPSRVHWRSVPADELCRLPLVKLHPGFSKGPFCDCGSQTFFRAIAERRSTWIAMFL